VFLNVLVFSTLSIGTPFYSYHVGEACLPSARGSSAYGLLERLRHPAPCASHARPSSVPAGEPRGNAIST
jgi:hypothetical protein